MAESNVVPTWKSIKISPNGKKTYPKGTVFTKIKFITSKHSGRPIGFVSQNPVTKRIKGVRENSEHPKSVCIVDAKIAPEIIPEVLYRVAMVPMFSKSGYIVIEATPHQFKATIEVYYVPKACYVVDVKFGSQVIRFDPKDGKKESMRTLSGCLAVLEKRLDIANQSKVIDEFTDAANDIITKYRRDGFIYKAS